jgi:putative DNA primase/helicase
MLELAKSEPETMLLPEHLDEDPFLLNVLNGTLDLRTGELRPHRREDRITKLAPVHYEKHVGAPLFARFLERITDGNVELESYLCRSVGYALTGSTRQQCLEIHYGTGANGKTVFRETIRAMLGDYALTISSDTLMARRWAAGNATPDVARLRGARFVIASESGQRSSFAEERVKTLTGGDSICARFLYQDEIEFEPSHKLFLATNHRPRVYGTDPAIWRRIHLVPFTVTIPEPEQDKELLEKLKKELSGILSWAVEGCLEWQATGLRPPEAVQKATNQYQRDMDTLGLFLEEETERSEDPEERIKVKDLYGAYSAWCERGNEKPMSMKAFGTSMHERRYERSERTKQGYFYQGLRRIFEVSG